jgi:hypothetical protein
MRNHQKPAGDFNDANENCKKIIVVLLTLSLISGYEIGREWLFEF